MKRFSFKMFAIALTIAALFLFASCGGGGNGDETASDGVNTGDQPPIAGDVDDGAAGPGPHYTGMDREVIELQLAGGISSPYQLALAVDRYVKPVKFRMSRANVTEDDVLNALVDLAYSVAPLIGSTESAANGPTSRSLISPSDLPVDIPDGEVPTDDLPIDIPDGDVPTDDPPIDLPDLGDLPGLPIDLQDIQQMLSQFSRLETAIRLTLAGLFPTVSDDQIDQMAGVIVDFYD